MPCLSSGLTNQVYGVLCKQVLSTLFPNNTLLPPLPAWLTFSEHLLCARHSSKCFTPHLIQHANNPIGQVLYSLYRTAEKQGDLVNSPGVRLRQGVGGVGPEPEMLTSCTQHQIHIPHLGVGILSSTLQFTSASHLLKPSNPRPGSKGLGTQHLLLGTGLPVPPTSARTNFLLYFLP